MFLLLQFEVKAEDGDSNDEHPRRPTVVDMVVVETAEGLVVETTDTPRAESGEGLCLSLYLTVEVLDIVELLDAADEQVKVSDSKELEVCLELLKSLL